MPRTKLSKNAKRNRDAAKDETLSTRLREFDLEVDQFLSDLEFKRQERLDENKSLANLVRTLPQRIHDMKMGELMAMVSHFNAEGLIGLAVIFVNKKDYAYVL